MSAPEPLGRLVLAFLSSHGIPASDADRNMLLNPIGRSGRYARAMVTRLPLTALQRAGLTEALDAFEAERERCQDIMRDGMRSLADMAALKPRSR